MADLPPSASWRERLSRLPNPDLGKRLGSPAWCGQVAVLVLLISGAVGLAQLPRHLGVNLSSSATGTAGEIPTHDVKSADAAATDPKSTTDPQSQKAPSSFWADSWDTQTERLDTAQAVQATIEYSLQQSGTLHIPDDATPDDAAPASAAGIAAADSAGAGPGEPEMVRKTEKVGRGESLAVVLRRAGVSDDDSHQAIRALSENLDMRRIRQGQIIELGFDPKDETKLLQVLVKPDVERIVFADRDGDKFIDRLEEVTLDRATIRAEGRISDSLYLAARRSLLPHDVIVELIHIFSFDVDFQRQIRSGDRFEVYYEHFLNDDGEPVKNGRILYAGLTVNGEKLDLYHYEPSDGGRSDYFAPDGQSARKALLKTPVDGARLTSGFGARRHPILGYTRMHKGSDFGARRGTPIRAAGDGVIERASRYGGYGNYVRIRHNGSYKTAYAHMKGYARGIRSGVRVRQGQIIGYVGTTGASTGPHLHYEVLKDGEHVNPMTLKMPSGRKLEGPELASFRDTIDQVRTEMASAPLTTQLASTE